MGLIDAVLRHWFLILCFFFTFRSARPWSGFPRRASDRSEAPGVPSDKVPSTKDREVARFDPDPETTQSNATKKRNVKSKLNLF